MFKNVKLGSKLMLGFSLVALITLILGIIGYYGAIKNKEAINEIGVVRMPGVEATLDVEVSIQKIVRHLRTLLIQGLAIEDYERQYIEIDKERSKYKETFAIYDSLPKTHEESREWETFRKLVPEWIDINNKALALHHEIAQIGIFNPDELLGQLQQFRGDHYALELKITDMILMGDNFDGGDDPTACNFGKWLMQFKTENQYLNELIQRLLEHHKKFHWSVNEIRNAVKSGEKENALKLFQREMKPAAQNVFEIFDQMIAEAAKVAKLQKRIQELLTVESRSSQDKVLEHLEQLVNLNDNIAKDIVKKVNGQAELLKIVSLITTISGIALAMIFGILITRSITRPVLQGVNFAQTISQGDMSQQIATDRNDEIGVLIKSLNNMSANLRGMFKEIITGVQTLSSSSIQLNSIAKQMSLGSEQTSGKAHTVAAAAEELSSNINSVAAAMEQTNTNMNLVASAAEEMTSTITEIAGNAEKVQQVTDSAEKEAQAASERVKNLGKAAQEIGKVTQVIAEISSQTNLLALNATIEAARAGEAGKGFAVVASEIKDLAKQTATAAEDIKNRIKGIQDATGSTVDEIIHISGVITQVNEGVSTIAAAVEEQSATTREIADNVAQASMAVSDVGQNVAESSSVTAQIARDISGVNLSASEMASSSTEVSMSAQELSKLAEQLKDMMGKFKV